MPDSILGNVSIESGVLGVGDPSLQISGGLHPDKWLQHVKDGKAAGCETGGDGTFGVIIRVTKESLDLLPEEGEKISSLSSPILISVPTGNLAIADMGFLDDPKPPMYSMRFKTDPGVYQCMIHMCDNQPKEFLGFVIVLKNAGSTEAKNDKIFEIEQLG